MFGVRKVVAGEQGWTTLGPIHAGLDVVGNELHYRGALRGLVDVLERDGNEWKAVCFSEDASTAASDSSDSDPRRIVGVSGETADMTAGRVRHMICRSGREGGDVS
jgi:hypothetical protein